MSEGTPIPTSDPSRVREHELGSGDFDFRRTDMITASSPSLPVVSGLRSVVRPSRRPWVSILVTGLGAAALGFAVTLGLSGGEAWLPAFGAALITGAAGAYAARSRLAQADGQVDLVEYDRRLRHVLGSASGTCLWTWREGGRLPAEAWFSEAWTETLGIPAGSFPGPEPWLERVHPEDLGALVRTLERVRAGDQASLRRHCRVRHGGEWRWIEVHARAVDLPSLEVTGTAAGAAGRPDQPVLEGRMLVGAVSDVTIHHTLQERLAHTAFHDALTGLPNRALFLDRLAHCTARARRNPRYRFAVVYLDIDDFKLINDSLGHHAGDALLAVVARRLLASARPGDTVARIGGDEFTILLEPVDSLDDAEKVAMRLRSVVHGNVEVAGHFAQVSTSVGIAFSSQDYNDPLDILRDADTAMYHAKRTGPGRQRTFDQAMRDSAMRRLRVETELRKALDGHGLTVHYQPVVNLQSGNIEGFEALARLVPAAGNFISPAEFIPLAEAQGLIDRVLEWVLDDATRRIAEWSRSRPGLYVSVNVSARSVNSSLVDKVISALANHDLPTSSLKLELTESVLVGPTPSVTEALDTLRRSGVGLFIDDFGTGYSSLSYLHQFPVDRIKLDRTFVMALDGKRMPEIVQTIVSLSQRIGASVIAEGIETRTQLAALRDLGCTAGQGFFFAPPVPADSVVRLLEEGRAWPIDELSNTRNA
ncbi:MAG: EAL domain-containing protein [Deltaproteobacteria bacterium]|nr:EAL domain-containing protein [Deltaproteobacteria bacterium]